MYAFQKEQVPHNILRLLAQFSFTQVYAEGPVLCTWLQWASPVAHHNCSEDALGVLLDARKTHWEPFMPRSFVSKSEQDSVGFRI